MFKKILLFGSLTISSCGQNKTTTTLPINATDNVEEQKEVVSIAERQQQALKFINGYTTNANQMNEAIDIVYWVDASEYCTKDFKFVLKKMVEKAYAEDPEYGLGADPIFDAQDFPTEGFEVASYDESTNYLTVKGIDWPEFTLTMKLKKEGGEWLVDGCGIVKIPEEKRAAR